MSFIIDSTGEMISNYLKENKITIQQLIEKSNVSAKTIALTINDTIKLNKKIAYAISELIPEISVEMLVVYDARYQLYKEEKLADVDVDYFNKIISEYSLRKIFKEEKNNTIKLYKRFASYIDTMSFAQHKIKFLDKYINYSKAKISEGSNKLLASLFVQKSIDDYKEWNETLKFNKDCFEKNFEDILSYCRVVSSNVGVQNMKMFCENSGINLILKKNVAGTRVKGACLKDDDNNVFMLLTDLFNSLESVLLTFIHECIHIKNEDYNVDSLQDDENEKEYNVDIELRNMIVKERFIEPPSEDMIQEVLLKNLVSKESPINLAYKIFESDTRRYNIKKYKDLYLHSFTIEETFI